MSEAERRDWARLWAEGDYHARSVPSALVAAWAWRIPKGRALDLACGNGRNVLYLAELGFTVDAVDIAPAALKLAEDAARERGLAIRTTLADLDEYPIPAETYDLIITSFYMNRNLIPRVKDALKPDGFVLHEQHYITDYDVSGPRDLQFRLRPNELLHLFLDFRVRFFSEGLEEEEGRLVAVERLVAQKHRASWEPNHAE
jgi:SAM-dependent methyltransferase